MAMNLGSQSSSSSDHSQASDVASIRIARSINHDDSTVLASLTCRNPTENGPFWTDKYNDHASANVRSRLRHFYGKPT
jgi:hypothetical protein